MLAWFTGAAAQLSANAFLQGLFAALATFVLEDPTTIGCGLLVADQRMAFYTALIGVSAGIAVGDVGLYGIGRGMGPTVIRRGWISRSRVDRVGAWFRQNMFLALIVSRFVPGMRLPTYLGAGILRASPARFVSIAIGTSLIWTFLLLRVTIALGQLVLPWLDRLRWPVAGAALLLLVMLQRGVARRVERTQFSPAGPAAVVSRFEFWPPWLFYIPVGLYYTWLALRFRGVMLPTAANPSIYSGGLIGESKTQILDLVPPAHQHWVARYTRFARPEIGTSSESMLRMAKRVLESAGLSYPVVGKPDVGQRGAGVQLFHRDADLQAYLESFPPGNGIVFQELAAGREGVAADESIRLHGVREAGVMYWRMPDSRVGNVFSITLKENPVLHGDGVRSLRQLIEDDPRASRIRDVYFRRHRNGLERVPARGESFPLVFAGNHCQGSIFRDGTDLVTPELSKRIHEIATSMPGFYFGRFDVRFDDPQAFLRGEDFKIIEINGAGAEATHIWDGTMGLLRAYGTLFRQFRILFEIGAANRARGHRSTGLTDVLRDALAYRRLARSYPVTH